MPEKEQARTREILARDLLNTNKFYPLNRDRC
jgi:hypothetical protein